MNNFFNKIKNFKPSSFGENKKNIIRKTGRAVNFSSLSFAGSLSIKDQMLFAKRLSFLINSGITMLEGLHILRDQTRSRSQVKIFDKLIFDVTNGSCLYASLSKCRGMFGDFAINIIKIGEMSGGLAKNLMYLADEMKKRHDLKRKITGALIYPVIISLGTLALTLLLTVYIFPKIMPIFTSLRVSLPLSTRVLLATSEFLRNYGLWLLLGVFISGIAFFISLRISYGFKYFVHRFLLLMPIIGNIMRTYNLTNFTRTLGTLLRSGIVLSDAVEITSDTTSNLVYKNIYKDLSARVRRGETISKSLKENKKFFPNILTHLIVIGENTGTLSDSLIYLSDLYESELDDFTKNISSSLEPVLMIVMGLVVGFVAISIITPIYEITQNLQR